MGFTEVNLPCDECGSSDAKAINQDGWSTCFSCGHRKNEEGASNVGAPASGGRSALDTTNTNKAELFPREPSQALDARSISQATCERFGYFCSLDSKGEGVHVAPYHDEAGRIVAQKIRYADKRMLCTGKLPGTLFGQHLWKPKKRIVITEGEIDCLSVYEVMGNWPVVSVPNGAQGAAKACAAQLDFLEGFEEVVLAFDMDEPGQDAAEKVAELLTPGKARIMQLPLKDPSEMLVAGRNQELRDAFWNAKPYQPVGLFRACDLWEEVSAPVPPAFFHYPWKCVDDKLMGARLGEIVIWTAGSGVGKSTATREIIHAALDQKLKVGVIALEESMRDTIRYQMALKLNTHLHLGDSHVSDVDLRGAFDAVSVGLMVHNHWGSLATEKLTNLVKYMAVGNDCQVIVLDHISMVVSGNESENERKDIDILMTRLRTLCEDLNINIQVVSHIKRKGTNKDGEAQPISKTDLRGSASLEQLSDQIVALERDDQDEDCANITEVRVLKNRPAGWLTGQAGTLHYDEKTGRLKEHDPFVKPAPKTKMKEKEEKDVGF